MSMHLIVLAGGASVRFGGPAAITKPLVEIEKSPLILHAIQPFLKAKIEAIHIAAGVNFAALSDHLATFELPLKVHDTSEHADTGGRLKRIADRLSSDRFFVCYADGLAQLDVAALEKAHNKSSALVTATLCNPTASYGVATIEGAFVSQFAEKPLLKNMWVNGGFYLVEREAIELIQGDETSWEADVLPQLARQNQLGGFQHDGEWVTVDSQKDIPAACAAVRRWGYV